MSASRLLAAVALLPVFGVVFFVTYMTLGFAGLPGVSVYPDWWYPFLDYGPPAIFVLIYVAVAWRLLRRKGI